MTFYHLFLQKYDHLALFTCEKTVCTKFLEESTPTLRLSKRLMFDICRKVKKSHEDCFSEEKLRVVIGEQKWRMNLGWAPPVDETR